MLALSIIALVIVFIFNIAVGVTMAFSNSGATYAVAVLALACISMAVVGLIGGIKGIRNPLSRGKSIATTIIAGVAISYGLAVSGVAFYAAATGTLLGMNYFENFSFAV